MKNNDEIVIYWASAVPPEHGNWSLLYHEPENLYDSLMSQKNPFRGLNNYLLCPAASGTFKRTVVAQFPHDASYSYDFTEGKEEVIPTSQKYVNFNVKRAPTINVGPTVEFSMSYSFFCEEDLFAKFTPPMFHPPKHTKYATVIPGKFNIGSWYRPYPLEMQFWANSGEVIFEEHEPLFYVEFETDRPVRLQRYVFTTELQALQTHCIKYYSKEYGEYGLIRRYAQFKKSGMNKLIAHEIKKNLVG